MEGEARWGRAAVIPSGALRNGPFGPGSPGLEQSRAMTGGRKCWQLEPGGKATPSGSPCAPQRAAPLRPGHAGVTGPPLLLPQAGGAAWAVLSPPVPAWPGLRRGCAAGPEPGRAASGRRHRGRTGQDRTGPGAAGCGASGAVLKGSRSVSCHLLLALAYNTRLKPLSKCAYFKNLIRLKREFPEEKLGVRAAWCGKERKGMCFSISNQPPFQPVRGWCI